MPFESTNGTCTKPQEPRVPRDAAALVAAAARLRGACSDAEAARVGTAEILALLRAPRDADSPSPRRLRARCGWALDHGVVDALVEAMRAHADCVPLQTLAATCLADVAEAFVGETEAAGVPVCSRDENELTPRRRGAKDDISSRGLRVPPRVPFDASSGVPTRAEACVDAFDAMHALKRARRDDETGARAARSSRDSEGFETKLSSFLATHLAHAPWFRDVDAPARRALARAASCRHVRALAPVFPDGAGDERGAALRARGRDETNETNEPRLRGETSDRTFVLVGEALVGEAPSTRDDRDAADAVRAAEVDLRAPLLSGIPEEHRARETDEADAARRALRFVAGDALEPESIPGAERAPYRAGAEGCAVVTVPGWALEARAVASAVDDGLRGFFGAAEEEEGEEGEEETDGPEAPTGGRRELCRRETGGERERVAAALGSGSGAFFETLLARAADSDSPHARLARDGAAGAVLHVALRCAGAEMRADDASTDGSVSAARRRGAALASACFSFLERLASPPCDDATRRRLGADGAMDRVVATKAALAIAAPLVAARADRDGTEDDARERDARVTRDALAAADGALRALARCEQNMRAAFSLGAAEVVW